MNLVVFDLDGTLVDTDPIDGDCYARAIRETLGITDLSRDWTVYRHLSDWGIAAEAHELRFGTALEAERLERTALRFLELLKDGFAADPASITSITGAHDLVEALPGRGWTPAIATGGFRGSAAYKLKVAGLATQDWPMAAAEDGPARVAIVTAAIRRAELRHGSPFERIVSVGDGVWDVRAAAALGLPFVGIGSAAHAVIKDFGEPDTFFALIEQAAVPIA